VTHPYLLGARRPRILAHRGLVTPDAAASGVAENSFAAVAAAHAAGAEYIESDCHLTRDGEVVLFHDDDLTRVAGDPRPIAEVTSRELDALMADRGGIITLPQALDAFPEVRWNLDVKAAAAAVPVGRAVAAHADRVLLTSFSDERRTQALAAAEAAGAERAPATSPGSTVMARLLAAVVLRAERRVRAILSTLDALQIPERHRGIPVFTPRLRDAAHRHGVEVHVWTVNEVVDMRRLLAAGVDGIVTDRADLALTLPGHRDP
jgi:glycerophosphoryl diester phosphodiesterase